MFLFSENCRLLGAFSGGDVDAAEWSSALCTAFSVRFGRAVLYIVRIFCSVAVATLCVSMHCAVLSVPDLLHSILCRKVT